MSNDHYYPSTAEDSYPAYDVYSEFPPAIDYPDDWMSSQEYDPIIPLQDSDSSIFGYDSVPAEWPGSGQSYPASNMTARPMTPMSGMPAVPMPDRPVTPMPDRPMIPLPDRPTQPIPPMPDRPTIPLPDRPTRPIPPMPDRPTIPLPDRPTRPIPPLPDRPMRPVPGRPVRPVPTVPSQPDWSWNWGVVLPGGTLPGFGTRVRFYNAAIQGPIQIYVNNRLVVSNLNYLNYTRYYNVAPGRYRITVYRGNNLRNPAADTWMAFRQNSSYTVMLAGSVSNYWLQSTTP